MGIGKLEQISHQLGQASAITTRSSRIPLLVWLAFHLQRWMRYGPSLKMASRQEVYPTSRAWNSTPVMLTISKQNGLWADDQCPYHCCKASPTPLLTFSLRLASSNQGDTTWRQRAQRQPIIIKADSGGTALGQGRSAF